MEPPFLIVISTLEVEVDVTRPPLEELPLSKVISVGVLEKADAKALPLSPWDFMPGAVKLNVPSKATDEVEVPVTLVT